MKNESFATTDEWKNLETSKEIRALVIQKMIILCSMGLKSTGRYYNIVYYGNYHTMNSCRRIKRLIQINAPYYRQQSMRNVQSWSTEGRRVPQGQCRMSF